MDERTQDEGVAGTVREIAGVRRLEEVLLDAVDRALLVAPDAPGDFARPVRVVVPSSSLRVHVASRIAQRRGRAAVGLVIQSLPGLALEVLARRGTEGADPLLFPVLVRRAARQEPSLAEGLEDRIDGYGTVVAAVDDLLDAGFEPAHADALEDHLEAQPLGRERTARARAVVRVAARVASRLSLEGVGHRSQLLVRARESIEQIPDALPHRALLLHGFADATGVQADLLATLVQELGGTLLLDAPQELRASGMGAGRAGPRFGAAFRERFPSRSEVAADADEAIRAPRVSLLEAPDPTAEVRAVALRLRACLDAGETPERLAVVARDLGPHRTLIRTQLLRLGIPFSGVGEHGAATAARRRLDALLALIAPEEVPAMETWLAARAERDVTATTALRRLCHRRGALRLEEVARLDAPQGAASARALLGALGARPGNATLTQHAAWLEGLVRTLHWRPETPGSEELRIWLETLPADPEVDAHEFFALLARGLEAHGRTPLGGEGGGVQVLSVMEARARSFERLFVVGLQRGAFPRSIREDALLPDAVRARLREVLPDLPVKRDGFDEERFLFAQLLSAADDVTLCWSNTNAEGRPQPRSPLLESVLRAGIADAHDEAAPLHAPLGRAVSRQLPASERALLAGLHGPRAGFGSALAAALGASAEDRAEPDASVRARAAARLAVLDELDPRDARRSGLGPYFGFVGEPQASDLRAGPLFVTRLESLARCPWQTFLTRVLRLAPVPDAAGELPASDDARLLGNVVHRALEHVVHRPLDDPEELASRDALPAEWPDAATLERWLEESAREELRHQAIAVPGYARVLARRARPYLERAHASDWRDGPPRVLGTEVEASARVYDAAGRVREVRFRADRVDRGTDGALVFTDYKTGKPIAAQKTLSKRDEALRKQVAEGRALQALLYARGGGAGARGRYLFLGEDAPEDVRALEVQDAPPWDEALDASLSLLLEAWDRGSFLPRLRRADRDEEPGACRFCEVRDACIRGDSGARARLERWGEPEGEARQDPAEQVALALYRLGVEP